MDEHRPAVLAELAVDQREVEGCSPAAYLAIVRRTFMVLFQAGLIDTELDELHDALRHAAADLGIPFAELWLAYYRGSVNGDDVSREEMAEWIAWCQQHAPERLARGTEAA
jgi:hypothetical protein